MKKIKMSHGRKLSIEDIERVEEKLRYRLPMHYRKFVLSNDGAEPESNIYPVGKRNASDVTEFIPLKKTIKERKYLWDAQDEYLPIAWDSCGNASCINLENGKVYFWDHEQQDLTYIAKDFNKFLGILKPFDDDDIVLGPNQVIEVRSKARVNNIAQGRRIKGRVPLSSLNRGGVVVVQ